MQQTAINKTNRLQLKKIRFGAVDARYEVTTRDPKVTEHFRSSYLEPAGLTIEEFVAGKRFFVHGVKGAGKTALLRFIQLNRIDHHCLTRFTSFASDISEADRDKMIGISGINTYEQKDVEVEKSAVDIWTVFIFRQIANIIEQNRVAFNSNRSLTTFCELIGRFYAGHDNKTLLSWLSKTLQTGKYKIKSRYVDVHLKGEALEEEREYDVSLIVEQCLKLLKDISWEGANGIYLFFDELNLSFTSRTTHRRDAILIRDLIIAVDRLNSYFIENGKPIYLIAAARSEVLHVINAPMLEINKMLADRGRELRWFSKNAGGKWPIVSLFEKKINASEKVEHYQLSDDVMQAYCHHDIFGYRPEDFIVEATWCNPRDLVLLFGSAAERAERNEPMFGSAVLNRVLDEYSTAAWVERGEELSVEYAPQEVQAIKKVLLNLGRHFKLRQFEEECERKGSRDVSIAQLIKKYQPVRILEDLFRVGVLGQSTSENTAKGRSFAQHWAYRGDNNFDPSAWCIVHKALWPELRLGRIGAERR